jgi:hypothetical protein
MVSRWVARNSNQSTTARTLLSWCSDPFPSRFDAYSGRRLFLNLDDLQINGYDHLRGKLKETSRTTGVVG